MTLGFSQEIKGVKNFFVAKIWRSFLTGVEMNGKQFINAFNALPQADRDKIDHVKPKLHTIRQGIGRWRAGMDIHMVINNRTSNRFQFAPTIKCKSVQTIKIKNVDHLSIGHRSVSITINYVNEPGEVYLKAFRVIVDCKILNNEQVVKLAINDGFDSVEAFFEYFNKDFTGTLIHWTDLKY